MVAIMSVYIKFYTRINSMRT